MAGGEADGGLRRGLPVGLVLLAGAVVLGLVGVAGQPGLTPTEHVQRPGGR